MSTEFEIRSNSPAVLDRLRYIGHRAEQDYALLDRHVVEVAAEGSHCRLHDDSGEPDVEVAIDSVVDVLYARMHDRALSAMPNHTRIHAASGIGPRGMFLLVGPKQAGKTTLALSMLEAGYEILGDELVLLQYQMGITFPRRFFVREGSLPLLPEVSALDGSAPFVRNADEGRLIAVDPIRLGREWRIRPARVATILFIDPDHAAESTMSVSGKVEMVEKVIKECTPPQSGRTAWIADLCQTVEQADTWTIHLGKLDSALLELSRVLR